MKIIKNFNNLIKDMKSSWLVEPKFYQVLQNSTLTEKEKLDTIKKNNLLENLSIKTFNNKPIEGFSVNALTYCLSNKMFNLATYFLDKKDINFSNRVGHEYTLETILKYLVIEESSIFFEKFYTKKIDLKNAESYFTFVLCEAQTEKQISGFIQAFNINLKNSFGIYKNAFEFLAHKNHVSNHAINAILNSNQFNREDLEFELGVYQKSLMKTLDSLSQNIEGKIKDKIVELTEQEAFHLDSILTQKETKPAKQKLKV